MATRNLTSKFVSICALNLLYSSIFLFDHKLSDLLVPISYRERVSKVTDGVPNAWLRCNFCFGTGYVFLPSGVSSKANMVGIVATMTNGRCKTCMGSGFVQYIDA